ncbi:MAG TPA: quinolinate synthase NadA [bacterium]|nr:quinolinate synthase NadA [bacterium]
MALTIQEEIRQLAQEQGAVILAHNYQHPEVQEIADFIGDSFELAKVGREVPQRMIVFCGVHFMAETAKILSPEKSVHMPDTHAGCPMANMISDKVLAKLKEKHPGAGVMAYVNSSAKVKAMSDVCCTSANAVQVAEVYFPEDQPIIFVPDVSLGAYVKERAKRKIILYEGFCPTHHRILPEDVRRAKANYPNAKVIAHPECQQEVMDLADYVESTSGMLRQAKADPAREFIVCTEQGLIHRLQREIPEKIFYSPSELNVCPNMKKTTLDKIKITLETHNNPIYVEEEVWQGAYAALERMMQTSSLQAPLVTREMRQEWRELAQVA